MSETYPGKRARIPPANSYMITSIRMTYTAARILKIGRSITSDDVVAAAALVARGGNLILGGHAWKDFNSATIGSNVGNQVLWAAGLGIFISSISVKSGKRGDLLRKRYRCIYMLSIGRGCTRLYFAARPSGRHLILLSTQRPILRGSKFWRLRPSYSTDCPPVGLTAPVRTSPGRCLPLVYQ